MLPFLSAPLAFASRLCWKPIKYFIDSTLRDKVAPVPGSVLYCDLWVAVEHSGIYVGNGNISNIVVDGFCESIVMLDTARSFTSKSTIGRKIYVSCDGDGAVGDAMVADKANLDVGERAFYGLVFKNCHQFSTRCVQQAARADAVFPVFDRFRLDADEAWELTLRALKSTARRKLGATKWRLWDWEADAGSDAGNEAPPPEPDWQTITDAYRHEKLTPASIEHMRAELDEVRDYEAEIGDEAIPGQVRQRLANVRTTLDAIAHKYDAVKDFLAQCPGAGFSYADLEALDEDFSALALTLAANTQVKDLARKMGRAYISEEKKKRARIPQASRNEVHGTHRSDDLMRMLPSELLNLEDETLESLFYARLLEKNLVCYELQGHSFVNGEHSEQHSKRTGPVVACLDTSGSMHGAPLHKAKALLLAIASILEAEDRSLHVLLFGAAGQLHEFSMDAHNDSSGLLRFLRQGFGGGTNYEAPLGRALDIVACEPAYQKADVLMISDGDCELSPAFATAFAARKEQLDCMVYSVLCAGGRVEDNFSDAVVVL